MSDYEIKLNSGSIFKNDFKTEDKHPTYKGKINVDGKIKDIALFVNTPESGKTYFGVAISDPYVKPEEQQSSNASPEVGDNLPF